MLRQLSDYSICLLGLYLLYRVAWSFISKRIYVKVKLEDSRVGSNTYINLYEYKKGEILPRGINKSKYTKEFKVNRSLIVEVDFKERVIYSYFNM